MLVNTELDCSRETELSDLTEMKEPTFNEVRDIIRFSSNKSSTTDPLPTNLLKENIQLHTTYLLNIARASFKNSTFPPILKFSHVTPVLKKHNLDGTVLTNYRPINNLPFASKIIERLVCSRLSRHLEETNALDVFQSAYRRNYSTETVVLKLISDLASALDEGKSVVLVAIDISAAFDTVKHNILIKRLRQSGVGGPALLWLIDYLSGRTQLVRYMQQESSKVQVENGVPQGSVLGPVLFNVYMAPLGKMLSLREIQHQIYADDVLIYFVLDQRGPCPQELSIYQRVLDDVASWMLMSFLSINPCKTQALMVHCGRKQAPTPPKLFMMGEPLDISTDGILKYLGVYVDSQLQLTKHIQTVCKSAYYHLKIIRRVRNTMKENTAKMLCNSLILSRVDYCSSILIGTRLQDQANLQRVINSAARVAGNIKRLSSVTPTLKKLGWLNIELRLVYHSACLIHKIIHCRRPSYLKLENYYPPRELRSQDGSLLELQSNKKKVGLHILQVLASKIWNNIPLILRNEESFTRFESGLRRHLLAVE
jgi:hypothetical protein